MASPPQSVRSYLLSAATLASLGLCLVGHPSTSAHAQGQVAPPAMAQGAPQPPGASSVPGAAAGTPGQAPAPPTIAGEWTLSDLLDGVLAMDKAGLPLSHEQAEQLKPALIRVMEASRLMGDTEKQIHDLLTPEQLALIEQAQRQGKLQPEALAGRPTRPGEDPVITKALSVLERKTQ